MSRTPTKYEAGVIRPAHFRLRPPPHRSDVTVGFKPGREWRYARVISHNSECYILVYEELFPPNKPTPEVGIYADDLIPLNEEAFALAAECRLRNDEVG